MLVLSRKKNEQVVIGDNIVVTVIEVRGDKVRLGFDAPKEVPVNRREVYEAIVSEGGTIFAPKEKRRDTAETPALDSVSEAQPSGD